MRGAEELQVFHQLLVPALPLEWLFSHYRQCFNILVPRQLKVLGDHF